MLTGRQLSLKKMKNFFRRLRFLTHSQVQLRLATTFAIYFFAFMAVMTFIFLFNFASLSERAESLPIHDQLLTKILLVDQGRNLAFGYGLAVSLYCFLMWAYLLIYSHRLTGPIYKINKTLEKALDAKEWPSPITLRKSDAFHELAETLNRFLEEHRPTK